MGDGWRTLYFHAPLAAALFAGAILLGADAWRRRGATATAEPAGPFGPGSLAAVGVAGALALLQAAVFPELHAFYAVPAMPFVALAAAWGPVTLAARLGRGERSPRSGRPPWCSSIHPLVARHALARAWPAEARGAGAAVRYPGPTPTSPRRSPARAARSSGPASAGAARSSRRGSTPSGASRPPSPRRPPLAAYVRANTSPDETLTGASTLAPLVALLADRRMAAGEADTNTKRFAARSLEEPEFLARILADRCAFVVASPRSFFAADRLTREPAWAAAFEPDRVFPDEGLGRGEPASAWRSSGGGTSWSVRPQHPRGGFDARTPASPHSGSPSSDA